ncbi:MAG: hypothetical protein ACYDH6_10925 [Acidimicrobiales bacterium]
MTAVLESSVVRGGTVIPGVEVGCSAERPASPAWVLETDDLPTPGVSAR